MQTAIPSNVVMHPREQLRQMRAKIAKAAQRLIDLLDQIDGDPDMEDGGDPEPSLGWTSGIDQRLLNVGWGSDLGVTDDLEQVCEDEGAQCDDEGHDSDSEPDDREDGMWNVIPFAMDQRGTNWAYGAAAE